MIRVNVDAAFRFAYTAVRHMKPAGGGHLLMTGSVLGTKVRPNAGGYCATKFAVEALCEALRMELAGSGVKGSVVEPGLVRTDLHRDYALRPVGAQGIPEPLLPDDGARPVVFALKHPARVVVPRVMVLPAVRPAQGKTS